MNATRPYLVRAFYDWIVDNGMTPYLLLNADKEGVQVPESYIQEGRIILDIHPNAVRDLNLGNDLIDFRARFQEKLLLIAFPVDAVLGIYAKENGQGQLFFEENQKRENIPTKEDTLLSKTPVETIKKPHLRIVK